MIILIIPATVPDPVSTWPDLRLRRSLAWRTDSSERTLQAFAQAVGWPITCRPDREPISASHQTMVAWRLESTATTYTNPQRRAILKGKALHQFAWESFIIAEGATHCLAQRKHGLRLSTPLIKPTQAFPHSAFHGFAFLADRSPLPGLMDILQRVGHLAVRVTHVDRNLADLRGCLHGKVAESLHVRAQCDQEAVHGIANGIRLLMNRRPARA